MDPLIKILMEQYHLTKEQAMAYANTIQHDSQRAGGDVFQNAKEAFLNGRNGGVKAGVTGPSPTGPIASNPNSILGSAMEKTRATGEEMKSALHQLALQNAYNQSKEIQMPASDARTAPPFEMPPTVMPGAPDPMRLAAQSRYNDMAPIYKAYPDWPKATDEQVHKAMSK